MWSQVSSVGIFDWRNDIKLRLFILLVHVIKYTSSKNVDIKLSAHEAFLEWPSSGTLKIERFESQII